MRSITPNFMVIIGGLKSADMIWTLLLQLSVVIPLRLEVGESCAAGSPRTFTTHNVPGAESPKRTRGLRPLTSGGRPGDVGLSPRNWRMVSITSPGLSSWGL